MLTLNEKQLHDFRVSGFDFNHLVRAVGKTSPLLKVEKFLYQKTGLHLGQTVIIKNSYKNKFGNLIIFPKTKGEYQIFPGSEPWDTWFTSIVGYDPKKKKFVIGKYFRGSSTSLNKKHFLLPDIRFLKRI